MAKFEVAVLHDKLIKRTTRDLMWTPLKPSDGSNDTYGLGWGVGNEDGIMTVGHTGGQQGTSTAFTIAPAKQAGVVVLTNMEGVGAGDLAAEILKILTGTEGASKQK
jgi:CubicO group peptidase (beta-lactamase class C family)